MRKFIVLLAVFAFYAFGSFAQNDNSNVLNLLKTFLSQQKLEKAYLQFDKPYYAAGDTIYFKAYITEGESHQFSDLSGVLHVDLINTENKIDQSIQLQPEGGTCHGDFALPDSLTAGMYRVRAYTQLMRNNGEASFFERLINIGSLQRNHVAGSSVKQPQQVHKDDLQFFPEGGNMVSGIYTKVAFKAIGTNGLAIDVKGTILDNANKEVGTFSSTHLGMGYFFIKANENNTYKANATFADGTVSAIDLPKPLASGISLIINNDSVAKTSITIEANEPYYKLNQNKSFLMIIYSAGRIISAPFKLDDLITTLAVRKEQLHKGVATVTLFSPEGEPLCERLLFVKNDQPGLSVNTDKTLYNKREKVKLLLNSKAKADSGAIGNFSVSVIDESKLPADEMNEHNILTDLLLTTDLKGYVEQPNYYFIDTSKKASESLDILMLTQGYRNFQWKEVFDHNKMPLTYQPEKGLEITGKVTTLKGIPLSNSTVTLIPSGGGPLLTSTSGENGFFHFSNLIFTDTMKFVLNAVNANQKNSTIITYLPRINIPPVDTYSSFSPQVVTPRDMQMYVNNNKKNHNEFIEDTLEKATELKNINIKGSYHTQSLMGAGNADQVLLGDDLDKVQGTLTTRLNGRLTGIGFSSGSPYLLAPALRGQSSTLVNSPMLIIVDGSEVNPGGQLFDIDQIDASQVETVEVLKYTGTSIYGVEGANGVLIITTKQDRAGARNIASVGVLPITPVGFYKARTFYSPKYDYANANITKPDLRTTIYWNPNLKTDKTGNASFEYYNADGVGVYKVVIEGIDSDGNIGRLVYRYQVK